MNTFQKTLFLGLACMALSACGGTGNGASPPSSQNPQPVASDGLGGAPGQSFVQRLAQTSYPKSLVNDPEAMKRILGPDTDNNGIRDDVDAFIATLTTEPVELKAFQQYAKSLQNRFLANDKNSAYAAGNLMVRAHKCGNSIAAGKPTTQAMNQYAAFDQISKKMRELHQKTVNNFERTIRSNEVDVLSHGHSFSFGPDDSGKQWCDQ